VHDTRQWLIVGVMVSSQAFFFFKNKTGDNMMCRVRTVGWMLQYCIQNLWWPLWCAYVCVA